MRLTFWKRSVIFAKTSVFAIAFILVQNAFCDKVDLDKKRFLNGEGLDIGPYSRMVPLTRTRGAEGRDFGLTLLGTFAKLCLSLFTFLKFICLCFFLSLLFLLLCPLIPFLLPAIIILVGVALSVIIPSFLIAGSGAGNNGITVVTTGAAGPPPTPPFTSIPAVVTV